MSYNLIGRSDVGAKLQVDPLLVGAWEKLTNFIPALTTKTIDTIPLTDFHSLDYILTFYNDTEMLSKRLQLNIIKEGTTLMDSVSGRLGNLPNVSITATVSAGNANIEINNGNNYQIELSHVRLTL